MLLQLEKTLMKIMCEKYRPTLSYFVWQSLFLRTAGIILSIYVMLKAVTAIQRCCLHQVGSSHSIRSRASFFMFTICCWTIDSCSSIFLCLFFGFIADQQEPPNSSFHSYDEDAEHPTLQPRPHIINVH
jgi:hypothetical protein